MKQEIPRAATPSIGDRDPGQFQLLARAIGNAGSPVLITDAEHRTVWANDAYSRLSGYCMHEIIGSTHAMHAQLHASYQATQPGASISAEPSRRELSKRRRDGTTYIADEVITPLIDPVGVISHFVCVLHDVTESRMAQQHERALANRDPLTGLTCRTHMLDLLNQALRQSQQSQHLLAVLFVDLDGFKSVNDNYGHHVGDAMLCAFAARLQNAVRCSDTVARFGGDEFVILMPAISHRQVAARLGQAITQLASQPFVIGTERHVLSASVGIALYVEHGIAGESLLVSADQAMYRAKRDGGGQYRWAEPVVAPTADGSPERITALRLVPA